jgi:hypothetical protein
MHTCQFFVAPIFPFLEGLGVPPDNIPLRLVVISPILIGDPRCGSSQMPKTAPGAKA